MKDRKEVAREKAQLGAVILVGWIIAAVAAIILVDRYVDLNTTHEFELWMGLGFVGLVLIMYTTIYVIRSFKAKDSGGGSTLVVCPFVIAFLLLAPHVRASETVKLEPVVLLSSQPTNTVEPYLLKYLPVNLDDYDITVEDIALPAPADLVAKHKSYDIVGVYTNQIPAALSGHYYLEDLTKALPSVINMPVWCVIVVIIIAIIVLGFIVWKVIKMCKKLKNMLNQTNSVPMDPDNSITTVGTGRSVGIEQPMYTELDSPEAVGMIRSTVEASSDLVHWRPYCGLEVRFGNDSVTVTATDLRTMRSWTNSVMVSVTTNDNSQVECKIFNVFDTENAIVETNASLYFRGVAH